MSMDRVLDFPSVKDFPELVNGVYDFSIEGFTETQLGKGKLAALRLNLRVTAPASDANLPWNENYFLGSEGDPDGTDPQKLSEASGMRNLRRLGRACGLDMDQRWGQQALVNAIIASTGFTGHIGASSSKKEIAAAKAENRPIKLFSNIDRYYKLGEVPAKHDGPATASSYSGPSPQANGAAGTARPAAVATATARPAAPTAAALPAGFSIEE